MKKIIKFILPYLGVFAIALLFLWVIIAPMRPQTNGQVPEVSKNKPKKLYALSPVNPVNVGKELTGTIEYTFDSSTLDKWVLFDFSRGSVVASVSSVSSFVDSKGWDLAFRRAKIISNGGGTNKDGQVEVAKLNTTDFDSVLSVPEDIKFVKDIKHSPGADPKNADLDSWYSYNFMDHHLKSHKNVYIIRTAEGNYAKMQFIDYYCENGNELLTGCHTIKYAYQGNGSKSFKNTSEPTDQQKNPSEAATNPSAG